MEILKFEFFHEHKKNYSFFFKKIILIYQQWVFKNRNDEKNLFGDIDF